MVREVFVSYAQNAEDVVLWRALGHVNNGRYVDIGANAPDDDSVTSAFYRRGWSGVDVEPVPYFAAALRQHRHRDTVVESAIADVDAGFITLHEVPGTGLSTLDAEVATTHVDDGRLVRDIEVRAVRLDDVISEHGLDDQDVHFLKVDVEGAEAEVLRTVDLNTWRPWVLVIEATAPNSARPTFQAWEPDVIAAGYEFCLFDGLSRFYVAGEHAEALRHSLSYPACILDNYVPAHVDALRKRLHRLEIELTSERDRLANELTRWRGAVLARWTEAVLKASPSASTHAEIERLTEELEAIRMTRSWRVTAPLRAARSIRLGTGAPT